VRPKIIHCTYRKSYWATELNKSTGGAHYHSRGQTVEKFQILQCRITHCLLTNCRVQSDVEPYGSAQLLAVDNKGAWSFNRRYFLYY